MSPFQGYVEPLEADLGRNLEFKSVETRRMNELYERALVLEVCKVRNLLFVARRFCSLSDTRVFSLPLPSF